jgi:hypothetical protein
MRRIPNDDADRLRTVQYEKYLLMGVRALGAASNPLLGRANGARPACGARQALPVNGGPTCAGRRRRAG